jgi:hypothetical protein
MSTQLVITESLQLLPTKAPALPFPTDDYSREYHNQLNSVLRIYFNTLDAFVAQLQAGSTSSSLKIPYGAFSCFSATTLTANITNADVTIPVVSTASFPTATVGAPKAFYINNETITYTGTTPTSFTGCVRGALGTTAAAHLLADAAVGKQAALLPATAYAVFFNTTDFSNEVSVVDTTKMTVVNPGIYNLQFSVQLENEDNAPDDVYIWLRQNGTDITGSTGKVGMPARKAVNDPSHDIKGWNYFLSMNAGDYIEIWWSTDGVNVTIPSYVATPLPTKPSTASVVATMTFVSAI